MRDQSVKHYLGAYDYDFELVVCDDIRPAVRRRKAWLGVVKGISEKGLGLCCTRDNRLWVFLKRKAIDHGLIAHELRHAVDSIFEYREIRYGTGECEETAALAQEYLTRIVYSKLKQFKTKIR